MLLGALGMAVVFSVAPGNAVVTLGASQIFLQSAGIRCGGPSCRDLADDS